MEKWEDARALHWLVVAAVSLALYAFGTAVLHAQNRTRAVPAVAVPESTTEDDSSPGNFVPPKREILQTFNRAQKVLKEHRYGEALEGLNQILRNGQDYLYQPDRKLPIYRSLKTEAQQLLGQMPQEGLDLYEVRNGAEAREKLKRAVAAGDEQALSEVSSQLFHTRAGYEATWLLALFHMDHGAPLAAALTLKRLHEAGAAAAAFEPGLSLTQAACYYQAGMTDDCRQVLVDLKGRSGRVRSANSAVLQLPGREIPWFEQTSEAPEWLAKLTGLRRMAAAVETDRWAMFRGDPSRNASTVGGSPLLNLRWKVPVTDNIVLEKGLDEQQKIYHDRGVPVFSGLHPLVVGDTVFMRTATNVLAIDFNTGKRLWPTPEEMESQDTRASRMPWMARNNMDQKQQYAQRIWDDATYGTLSSDGNLLFVIEELPLGVTGGNNAFIFMGNGRNDTSTHGTVNKLAAYDIRTGKVIWSLGGRDAEEMPASADSATRDAFFLGPPLPLRGQLYVMAEVKDEIRLLALDAAKGSVVWKQQLATLESNITTDPIRRLAGVSPSYSDGVLVCPTGSGCVVAVDLATRALLWGYAYSHPGEPQAGPGRRNWRFNMMQNSFNSGNGPVPRWLDGTALVVNGRVLLTPAEADCLYCLNLADGKPAWDPQPRGEHFYVACVHQGKVVLVGRTSIDAIKLQDGKKAWDSPLSFPSGAGACGHGFYAGAEYFLPLTSGEVVAVDLNAGKIVATAKSRRNAVPGNLVCYRGRVLSQGFDGLELYYQADAAQEEVTRRLKVNPDDSEGLTLRGEMLLDAGKSAEAVTDFRRAYSLDKNLESHARTRELLRDALLAGLRDDFPTHRNLAGEVESLLDDAAQRATYFRYMAAGLEQSGDWRQAVDYLLKLVDLDEKPALEKVDRSHRVRRDCWVQARLGLLRAAGGADAGAQIDRALEQRLSEAKMDTGLRGLKHFIAWFGNQPLAAQARAELRERLFAAGRILDAEMLAAAAAPISTGNSGQDRQAQAGLLAEMAAINLRASHGSGATRDARVADAAACFRQLLQQYADVPCHDGKTAAQWLAAVPKGSPADADDLHKKLEEEVHRAAPTWPQGEVEAARPEVNGNPFVRGQRFDMLLGGGAPGCRVGGPYFADYTISWDSSQQEVSLRDGLGHTQNPVRLIEGNRVYGGMYNPNSTLARSCGHLLLVTVGTKIYALDPWKAADSSSPILWRQDLVSDSNDENVANPAFVNNGIDRDFHPNPFGPVNARYVAFQRRRNIVAVDPVSGEELWERRDVPPGSEVFGDEQYMLVLSSGSSEAAVYRALDGQFLGTRKIPGRKVDENNNPNAPGVYSGNPYGGNSVLSDAGIDFRGRCVLTWQMGGESNGRVLGLFDPWLQKAVWPSRTFVSGSRVSVVGNEAVGVLEPAVHEKGGDFIHFILIGLADGRTIADLKLEARPHFPVTDLVVTRLGDQYIVITHDNRMLGGGNEEQSMQAPQGVFCYPLRRARIYAIDLEGKPAWPAPVDVDHQQFLLSQPGRLPVLVFVAFHFENRMGQNQQTMRTSMVAVDRRNGRIVYDNADFRGPIRWSPVDITGDAEQKTVRIATNNDAVSLLFTDKPIKTSVRRSTGIKRPSGKLGDALLDALGRAAGTPQ